MSADLHIHVVYGPCTEEHAKSLLSNVIGSKYDGYPTIQGSYKIVGNSPNIWVGEVSWLKASIFEDSDSFISNTVGEINDIIGEDFPVIDEEMINKIDEAFDLPNKTNYKLADRRIVIKFLKGWIGHKVFTVSW